MKNITPAIAQRIRDNKVLCILTTVNKRRTVLFAEEDVMEYQGGMQIESTLIHEFGHVIHGAGFDDSLQKRLTQSFPKESPKLLRRCLDQGDILGNNDWRFVSPRKRAGTGHLKSYDPTQSPVVVQADFIQTAALDCYDKYWTPYWQRLRDKHAEE
jgi:hypothetical protein